MPRVVKPRTLGFLQKVERRRDRNTLFVSVMGLFDLANSGAARFGDEQTLWPMVAKCLPPGRALDICMPKPFAEVMVGGYGTAPDHQPVSRLLLEWRIAAQNKRLLLSGDRWWTTDGKSYVPTAPLPFSQMPLAPSLAFGGEGHRDNPEGVGFDAVNRVLNGKLAPLPNIEVPERAIQAISDQPPAASFGPISFESRERDKYAGTYDDAWAKTVAPGLPYDADPRLFMMAPQDQWLDGFLTGGEPYHLRNFGGHTEIMSGRVPDFRARAFIGKKDSFKEIGLRIDTLWLFAGARRGIVIYRGASLVDDVEGLDVTDIVIGYEAAAAEPRSLGHYAEVRRQRLDPETGHKYAFAEYQLAPPLDPAVVARREQERKAKTAERKAASAAAMGFVADEMFERSGLPQALWPQLSFDTSPVDMPDIDLPLPEELESGEFDLAALLDSIEVAQDKAEQLLNETSERLQPKMDAMKALADPDLPPDEMDQHFAAIGLGNVLTDLDALSTKFQGEDLPADINADWRQAILATRKSSDEMDRQQFELSRAKFLGLPEARPFAEIRRQLADAAGQIDLSKFTGLPDEGIAANGDKGETEDRSFNALLASLEGREGPSAGEHSHPNAALAEGDAKLVELFPALAAGSGSPRDALIDLLSPEQSEIDHLPIDRRIGAMQSTLTTTIDDALIKLDESETRMIEGTAKIRLASPRPIHPLRPLHPDHARAFGQEIHEAYLSGESLAGRDMAGADLSGLDLSGADLSGAFLESARLDGANLSGARLVETTLAGASFAAADVSNADLTRANLGGANLTGARFVGARLESVGMLESVLSGADFDQATLIAIQLIGTEAAGASFRQAKLSKMTFIKGKLANSRWAGADLSECQFVEVNLDRADFSGAQLQRSVLLKSSLNTARFSGATLARVAFIGDVDLAGSRFDGAIADRLTFGNADLSAADFTAATLKTTCFTTVNLERAVFRRANMRRTMLSRNSLLGADFLAANLMEAQLNRADLSGATFRGANLYGADLMDSKLLAADLSGANLDKTILAVPRDVH